MSIETKTRTLKALLRLRTLCLVLMMVLLYSVEEGQGILAVSMGWDLLLAGALSGLFFSVLAKTRRFSGPLLPVVMAVDALFLGAWVAVSGGALSPYLPFFLLVVMACMLALPPRAAWITLGWCLAVLLAALTLSLQWDLPATFEAGRMDPGVAHWETLAPALHRSVYVRESVRALFLLVLTAVTCGFLMRQVWVREEGLRQREKALEQKRHLIQMGELTGRLAHGVNTPLGLISGNLEMLLAETPKRGKGRQRLLRIEQYVQRAIRTVRDILTYGRQSMSEIRPTDIIRVARAVAEAVQPRLRKVRGHLVLDLAPDLPFVMAYPEGLFQALLNLVENGVDSIPPGGMVTLTARFHLRSLRLSAEDRRGEVHLLVRDSGKGVGVRDLQRIFEPYYSTKGFGKGTGLGLSIVKRIVEEHQGTLSVESKQGEGTVFRVVLPVEGPGGVSERVYNADEAG